MTSTGKEKEQLTGYCAGWAGALPSVLWKEQPEKCSIGTFDRSRHLLPAMLIVAGTSPQVLANVLDEMTSFNSMIDTLLEERPDGEQVPPGMLTFDLSSLGAEDRGTLASEDGAHGFLIHGMSTCCVIKQPSSISHPWTITQARIRTGAEVIVEGDSLKITGQSAELVKFEEQVAAIKPGVKSRRRQKWHARTGPSESTRLFVLFPLSFCCAARGPPSSQGGADRNARVPKAGTLPQ